MKRYNIQHGEYCIVYLKEGKKIHLKHSHHVRKNFNYIYGSIWKRQWQPTPVLLPGKSHGWRSLLSCSPWGPWGLDMTEQLHFHFSLSRIGEGNGNPLQCSCLENPRDGGAWWAAVYGVAQSRTRLKWLSSNCMDLYIWSYIYIDITRLNVVIIYQYTQIYKHCVVHSKNIMLYQLYQLKILIKQV